MQTYTDLLHTAGEQVHDLLTGAERERETRSITYDEACDLLDGFDTGTLTKLPYGLAGAHRFPLPDSDTAHSYLEQALRAYRLDTPQVTTTRCRETTTHDIRFQYFEPDGMYGGELVFTGQTSDT